MTGPCSRRRVLRAGGASALALALAGCSTSLLDELRVGDSCELRHEILDSGESRGYGGEHLAYEELSDRGQRFFEAAVESGSHVVDYDGANAPPEFSYSDEATSYVVAYEGDEYTLLTYTSEGCVVD